MYRPTEDDFDYAPAYGSAEPMPRADHKAKKHPRPRRNEKIGGGHFVFRRGKRTGRVGIKTSLPFEHPDFDSAMSEARRLAAVNPGETFEVFASTGASAQVHAAKVTA